MHFRLFGMNVEIQPFFWISAFILGLPILQEPGMPKIAIGIWVLIVLVSVMVHEFGHAFAIRRHGIEPAISLHFMGGATTWRAPIPLRRIHLVLISLAGPFAGFGLAGLLMAAEHFLPGGFARFGFLGAFAYHELLWVNIYWGAINLIPVLPFDGGHVLEHALGPKRGKITAVISFVVGAGVAIYALTQGAGYTWMAMIFGLGAFQSYQRFSAGGQRIQPVNANVSAARAAAAVAEAPIPNEFMIPLRRARQALAEENIERAIEIANQVLGGVEMDGAQVAPPPRAMHAALEILAWAHLLGGRTDDATEALDSARRIGPPDASLVAAILLAKGMKPEARRILEAARAAGDDRKETVGPLIQILIEQGEIARAAAVALDIVDSLSEDDARKMAEIAFTHGSYDWSARLREAMFLRTKSADDAYEAARALTKDRQNDRAIELLRRAVEAGFSDRARAWSDAALEPLRAAADLEAVVPRP